MAGTVVIVGSGDHFKESLLHIHSCALPYSVRHHTSVPCTTEDPVWSRSFRHSISFWHIAPPVTSSQATNSTSLSTGVLSLTYLITIPSCSTLLTSLTSSAWIPKYAIPCSVDSSWSPSQFHLAFHFWYRWSGHFVLFWKCTGPTLSPYSKWSWSILSPDATHKSRRPLKFSTICSIIIMWLATITVAPQS